MFWTADTLLRARSWKVGDNKVIRESRTGIRYSEQLADVAYAISVYDKKNKLIRKINETQTNRYFLVQEMNLFLTSAGFEPIKWFDGYSNKSVNENSWHTVCVAKRQ